MPANIMEQLESAKSELLKTGDRDLANSLNDMQMSMKGSASSAIFLTKTIGDLTSGGAKLSTKAKDLVKLFQLFRKTIKPGTFDKVFDSLKSPRVLNSVKSSMEKIYNTVNDSKIGNDIKREVVDIEKRKVKLATQLDQIVAEGNNFEKKLAEGFLDKLEVEIDTSDLDDLGDSIENVLEKIRSSSHEVDSLSGVIAKLEKNSSRLRSEIDDLFGGIPVGSMAAVASVLLLERGAEKLADAFADVVLDISSMRSELKKSESAYGNLFKGNTLSAFARNLGMTKKSMADMSDEFGEINSALVKSNTGFSTFSGMLQNVRNTMGKVDSSSIKEIASILDNLSGSQVNVMLNGVGNMDDAASLLMNLMKNDKLDVAIEMMAKGAFGEMENKDMLKLSEVDRKTIENQEIANRILEDMRLYLYDLSSQLVPFALQNLPFLGAMTKILTSSASKSFASYVFMKNIMGYVKNIGGTVTGDASIRTTDSSISGNASGSGGFGRSKTDVIVSTAVAVAGAALYAKGKRQRESGRKEWNNQLSGADSGLGEMKAWTSDNISSGFENMGKIMMGAVAGKESLRAAAAMAGLSDSTVQLAEKFGLLGGMAVALYAASKDTHVSADTEELHSVTAKMMEKYNKDFGAQIKANKSELYNSMVAMRDFNNVMKILSDDIVVAASVLSKETAEGLIEGIEAGLGGSMGGIKAYNDVVGSSATIYVKTTETINRARKDALRNEKIGAAARSNILNLAVKEQAKAFKEFADSVLDTAGKFAKISGILQNIEMADAQEKFNRLLSEGGVAGAIQASTSLTYDEAGKNFSLATESLTAELDRLAEAVKAATQANEANVKEIKKVEEEQSDVRKKFDLETIVGKNGAIDDAAVARNNEKLRKVQTEAEKSIEEKAKSYRKEDVAANIMSLKNAQGDMQSLVVGLSNNKGKTGDGLKENKNLAGENYDRLLDVFNKIGDSTSKKELEKSLGGRKIEDLGGEDLHNFVMNMEEISSQSLINLKRHEQKFFGEIKGELKTLDEVQKSSAPQKIASGQIDTEAFKTAGYAQTISGLVEYQDKINEQAEQVIKLMNEGGLDQFYGKQNEYLEGVSDWALEHGDGVENAEKIIENTLRRIENVKAQRERYKLDLSSGIDASVKNLSENYDLDSEALKDFSDKQKNMVVSFRDSQIALQKAFQSGDSNAVAEAQKNADNIAQGMSDFIKELSGGTEKEKGDADRLKMVAQAISATSTSAAKAYFGMLESELKQKKLEIEKIENIKNKVEAKEKEREPQQEMIDTMLDYANDIGLPFEKILELEAQTVDLARERFEDELAALEEMRAAGVGQLAIKKQEAQVAKTQAELTKKALGAQRSAMDKMLGSIMGTFSDFAGIAGELNTAAVFGQGYVENSAGIVTGNVGQSGGWENRQFNAMYGGQESNENTPFNYGEIKRKKIPGYATGGKVQELKEGKITGGSTSGDRILARVPEKPVWILNKEQQVKYDELNTYATGGKSAQDNLVRVNAGERVVSTEKMMLVAKSVGLKNDHELFSALNDSDGIEFDVFATGGNVQELKEGKITGGSTSGSTSGDRILSSVPEKPVWILNKEQQVKYDELNTYATGGKVQELREGRITGGSTSGDRILARVPEKPVWILNKEQQVKYDELNTYATGGKVQELNTYATGGKSARDNLVRVNAGERVVSTEKMMLVAKSVGLKNDHELFSALNDSDGIEFDAFATGGRTRRDARGRANWHGHGNMPVIDKAKEAELLAFERAYEGALRRNASESTLIGLKKEYNEILHKNPELRYSKNLKMPELEKVAERKIEERTRSIEGKNIDIMADILAGRTKSVKQKREQLLEGLNSTPSAMKIMENGSLDKIGIFRDEKTNEYTINKNDVAVGEAGNSNDVDVSSDIPIDFGKPDPDHKSEKLRIMEGHQNWLSRAGQVQRHIKNLDPVNRYLKMGGNADDLKLFLDSAGDKGLSQLRKMLKHSRGDNELLKQVFSGGPKSYAVKYGDDAVALRKLVDSGVDIRSGKAFLKVSSGDELIKVLDKIGDNKEVVKATFKGGKQSLAVKNAIKGGQKSRAIPSAIKKAKNVKDSLAVQSAIKKVKTVKDSITKMDGVSDVLNGVSEIKKVAGVLKKYKAVQKTLELGKGMTDVAKSSAKVSAKAAGHAIGFVGAGLEVWRGFDELQRDKEDGLTAGEYADFGLSLINAAEQASGGINPAMIGVALVAGLGRGMMMSEEEADYFLQNELWLKDEGILGNAGRIWDRKSLIGQGVGALVAKDMGIVKDIGNIEAETVTKKAAQSNKIDANISRAGSVGEMSSEEQKIYDEAVKEWQDSSWYRAYYDNYLGVYGNQKDVNKTDIAIKQKATEYAYAAAKKRGMRAVNNFRNGIVEEVKEVAPTALEEFSQVVNNEELIKFADSVKSEDDEYAFKIKGGDKNGIDFLMSNSNKHDLAKQYVLSKEDLSGEALNNRVKETLERYYKNAAARSVIEEKQKIEKIELGAKEKSVVPAVKTNVELLATDSSTPTIPTNIEVAGSASPAIPTNIELLAADSSTPAIPTNIGVAESSTPAIPTNIDVAESASSLSVKDFAKMLHNTSFDKLYHMGQDYVLEYENLYKEDEPNVSEYKDVAYQYLEKYHDLNGYTNESFDEKASELTERYRRNKIARKVLKNIKEEGELDRLSNLGSYAGNASPAAVLPVNFNDSPNGTSGSESGSGIIQSTVKDSNITSDVSVAMEKIKGMRSYDLGGDFFDAITGDSYGKLDFSQPSQVKAYEEYYKADDINIPLYKDQSTKIAESYFSKAGNYSQEDFDKKVFQTIEKYRQEKAARFALKYSDGERSVSDPYKIMEFRDNRIGALNRAEKLMDFDNYSKPFHFSVDNLDPTVKEKYDMYYGDDAKNYMKYYEVADDYVDKYYRKNGWKEDRLKVKREELIENYRKNKALKFAMNITSGRVLAEGFATGGKTNDNVYGFSNVNKTIDPDSIQKQVVNRGRGDYGKVDVSGISDGIDNVVVSVSNGKESIVKNEWLDNLTPYVAGGLGTSHITNEDVLGLAAGKRATGGVVSKNGIKGFKNTGSPGRAKTTFDFGMGSDIVSTDNSSESILKEILETAKEQTSILASAFGAGAKKEDEKIEWEKIKANSQKIIDASKPSQNVDADSIVLAIEKASKFISINLIKHSIEKDGDKPQQIKLVDVKESNYGQDVINGKPDYITSSTNYDVAVNPHEDAKKYAERFAPRVSQPLATIYPRVGNAQPPNPAGSDGGKGNSTQVFGEVEVKSNVVVTVVPNEEGLKTYVVKVIEQSPTAIGKALLSGSKN